MTTEANDNITIADLHFGTYEDSNLGFGLAQVRFDNGYGASIAATNSGYEVAVTRGNRLCYDTPITDDVLKHLTEARVNEVLEQIRQLPSRF